MDNIREAKDLLDEREKVKEDLEKDLKRVESGLY